VTNLDDLAVFVFKDRFVIWLKGSHDRKHRHYFNEAEDNYTEIRGYNTGSNYFV
jgi:hypothetical protein